MKVELWQVQGWVHGRRRQDASGTILNVLFEWSWNFRIIGQLESVIAKGGEIFESVLAAIEDSATEDEESWIGRFIEHLEQKSETSGQDLVGQDVAVDENTPNV